MKAKQFANLKTISGWLADQEIVVAQKEWSCSLKRSFLTWVFPDAS